MSPRTKEQFEQMRTDRKEAIMDAALHVFAEEGYHSASISKVSKAAGVSKGLMYNYFESKEELLKALLHTILHKEGQFVRDLVKRGLTDETFKELIHHTRDLLKEDPKHWKLYFHMAIQPEVLAIILEDHQGDRAELTMQFVTYFEAKYPGDGMRKLHYFNSVFSGVKMNFIMDTVNYPLDDMCELVIEQFVNGN